MFLECQEQIQGQTLAEALHKRHLDWTMARER